MAVYKVPQDVEADDKLIGPFSFRQFIYLIIVAISGAAAWGLSQIFLPLVIIPMPFIVFFAALALPLRKDQPMETYLSAVVSFYFLKSRRRFWVPDGIDSFITIIPPKSEDIRRTKDFGEDEAARRLGYLSELVDSHGWSVRGEGVPAPDTAMKDDLYYESQSTPDVFDTDNDQSRRFSQGLEQSAQSQRQTALQSMQPPAAIQSRTDAALDNPLLAGAPPIDPFAANQYQPATPYEQPFTPQEPIAPAPQVQPTATEPELTKEQLDIIAYAESLAKNGGAAPATPENERPASSAEQSYNSSSPELQLSHATPLPQPKQPQSTSATPVPNATINGGEQETRELHELAYQPDISIATVQKEAKRRIEEKKVLTGKDEVTISLR